MREYYAGFHTEIFGRGGKLSLVSVRGVGWGKIWACNVN